MSSKHSGSAAEERPEEDDVPASSDADRREDGPEDGYDEEEATESEQIVNNHDLVGVEGIIRAQKNEIEKKKVSNAPAEIGLPRFGI